MPSHANAPRHGGHQLRRPVGRRQVYGEPVQRREQVVRLQRRKQVRRRQPVGQRIVQVGLVEVRVVVQVGRRLGLREPLPLVADKERRREPDLDAEIADRAEAVGDALPVDAIVDVRLAPDGRTAVYAADSPAGVALRDIADKVAAAVDDAVTVGAAR